LFAQKGPGSARPLAELGIKGGGLPPIGIFCCDDLLIGHPPSWCARCRPVADRSRRPRSRIEGEAAASARRQPLATRWFRRHPAQPDPGAAHRVCAGGSPGARSAEIRLGDLSLPANPAERLGNSRPAADRDPAVRNSATARCDCEIAGRHCWWRPFLIIFCRSTGCSAGRRPASPRIEGLKQMSQPNGNGSVPARTTCTPRARPESRFAIVRRIAVLFSEINLSSCCRLVVVFAQGVSPRASAPMLRRWPNPEALSAIRLTLLVAAISVSLNLVFRRRDGGGWGDRKVRFSRARPF